MAKMTSSHFKKVAVILGHTGRRDTDARFEAGLDLAVLHLHDTNSSFDEDQFRAFAHDVRDGRRDLDGKPIPAPAVGFELYKRERQRLGI